MVLQHLGSRYLIQFCVFCYESNADSCWSLSFALEVMVLVKLRGATVLQKIDDCKNPLASESERKAALLTLED